MRVPSRLPIGSSGGASVFTYIPTDWFGNDVFPAPGFRLLAKTDSLEFAMRLAGGASAAWGGVSGGFREGLWQHDCGELFLCNPASGAYLEFNLSPDGSWWACRFTAPRVRALPTEGPWPDARIEALAGETRLSLPLAGLEEWLGCGLAAVRGNVTFCLGDAPAQKLLSFAEPSHGAPDFHRPDLWLPVDRSA